ncbi:hypothetical protein E2C01_058976 [Portunus trituberculatus]|uniref:Uncharacterized protein n=1 Tax=Portunus trituberculatus TaxID=210409 RepID=A0A5B7H7T5_PORTR|nr:hypothetical protein [Portunus trituberculatus]
MYGHLRSSVTAPRISWRCLPAVTHYTLLHKSPTMKDTPAFLLLLLFTLLLLLLAPGGFLGSAHAQQCPPAFHTVDQEYLKITTAHRTYEQINTNMYVRPQRDLRVVLGVEGSDKNHTAEFVMERDCFKGDWQWWELWVKMKELGTYKDLFSQVKAIYNLQVRTSECIKPCVRKVYMQGLVSLHVWASGASHWRLDHPGTHCGHIPQWKRGGQWDIPKSTDVNLSSLVTTPHLRPHHMYYHCAHRIHSRTTT